MNIASTGYENSVIVVFPPDAWEGLVCMLRKMEGFQFRFTHKNGYQFDGEVTDRPGNHEDEIVIEEAVDGRLTGFFRHVLLRDVKEIYYY